MRCFFHVASRAQVRSLLDMPELSTLFAVGLAPFATIGARRARFDERRVNKRGSVQSYDYGSMCTCGMNYSSACTTYIVTVGSGGYKSPQTSITSTNNNIHPQQMVNASNSAQTTHTLSLLAANFFNCFVLFFNIINWE